MFNKGGSWLDVEEALVYGLLIMEDRREYTVNVLYHSLRKQSVQQKQIKPRDLCATSNTMYTQASSLLRGYVTWCNTVLSQ